jgi:hypothetical protein
VTRLIAVFVVLIWLVIFLAGCTTPTNLAMDSLNQGSGIPEQTAYLTWRSAEPFGIVDYSVSGSTLSLVLKNNSAEDLTLSEVSISTGKYSEAVLVPAGQNVTITLSGFTECVGNSTFSVPKSSIVITYISLVGKKSESGVADLIGKCN